MMKKTATKKKSAARPKKATKSRSARKAAVKKPVRKPAVKSASKSTTGRRTTVRKASAPAARSKPSIGKSTTRASVSRAGSSQPALYRPDELEPRWQKRWEQDGLYRAVIDPKRPKHYALTMLPYTSGDLHFGHWYPMAPSDARARFKRMNGYNVLFPIGFDAFGLPAENAAIKRGIHPKKWTYDNIANMRRQLRGMGTMFDWEREAISADPEYYKWTQWFFIQLFKHGLAYRKLSAVDWCPKDNTTLAREQVVGDNRVLRALRHAGHQEGPGAVVLQGHRLRRRAAELRGHRLARARQDPADQLDRPQ